MKDIATQKEALEYAERACKETNITCVVYEKKFEVIPEVVVSVKEVSKNARCKNSKN